LKDKTSPLKKKNLKLFKKKFRHYDFAIDRGFNFKKLGGCTWVIWVKDPTIISSKNINNEDFSLAFGMSISWSNFGP